MEETIPKGKVKTVDGKIIDRADACFRLRPHSKSPNLFYDHNNTCYVKDSNGTLRRYPQKTKGKKKNKNRDRFGEKES